MSELKLEVGKFYKTRNGKKAYVAANVENPFGETTFPLIGFIRGESGDCGDLWTAKGRFSTSVCDHESDLVGEWRDPIKVSGWVNVYPDGYMSSIYATEKEANKAASLSSRIACIYVSGEEGKEP